MPGRTTLQPLAIAFAGLLGAGAAGLVACGESRDAAPVLGGTTPGATGTSTSGLPPSTTVSTNEHASTVSTIPSPQPPVPVGTAVNVEAREYRLTPSRRRGGAGTVEFTISNTGRRTHEFKVIQTARAPDRLPLEGRRASEAGKVAELPPIQPGRRSVLLLRLAPGSYVLLCNLPGHYRRGMAAGFAVTPA